MARASEKPIGKIEEFVLKSSGLLAFILLWEALPRFGVLDPQFLPTFTATLAKVWEMLLDGVIFTSVMVSLWRVLAGLIVAAAVAVPLGFVIGAGGRSAEIRTGPLFRLLSQVNPFSLMPIFILFFGIGEVVKIAVVAWTCLWPLLFNTIEGVRNADPVVVKTAKAMSTPKLRMLTKVLLPEASPSIFSGLRIGVEMSFFMLIAAEMVGATSGIGWLLHNSAMNMQIGRIYAASLAAVALGYALSRILRFLQAHAFFWREELSLSRGDETQQKQYALKKWQMTAALAFLVLLLAVGTWQVEVSRQKQAQFNHVIHEHIIPAGQIQME
ncbi:MAG TPA: ABC transporter permease [Anaerovoracaceae bacterium]|nr:ABC transporter permease [Anaerovoracaceae bacterium]